MCGPLFSKIHQRALSMSENASNQKTDATLKNQLFKLIKILKFRVEVRKLNSRTNLDKSQLDKGQRHPDAGNLHRGSQTKTPTKKGSSLIKKI